MRRFTRPGGYATMERVVGEREGGFSEGSGGAERRMGERQEGEDLREDSRARGQGEVTTVCRHPATDCTSLHRRRIKQTFRPAASHLSPPPLFLFAPLPSSTDTAASSGCQETREWRGKTL